MPAVSVGDGVEPVAASGIDLAQRIDIFHGAQTLSDDGPSGTRQIVKDLNNGLFRRCHPPPFPACRLAFFQGRQKFNTMPSGKLVTRNIVAPFTVCASR